MMAVMDYLLTPEEKALKEALRSFVALEVPSLRAVASPDKEITEILILKVGEFLRERKERPEIKGSVSLSGVETVIALEEILKGLPTAGPESAAGMLFEGLSPEVRSSAALLGSAQGVLASCVGRAFSRHGLEASGHDCGALDQELADVLSAIEAARLLTFRAAILDDEERPDSEEAAKAKLQAEELASRAEKLAALIKKGEHHET